MKHLKLTAKLTLAASLTLAFAGCSQINEDSYSETSGVSASYILPAVSETLSESTSGSETEYDERYAYSCLSDDEKIAYDKLLEAVRNYENEVEFDPPLDGYTAAKLLRTVYNQEPRIFWMDSKIYYTDENSSLSIFYRYDKEQSENMRAMLDIAAGNIIGSLPENCSEYEAVKVFHDSIVLGCDFSLEGEYVHTAYGALVDGKAQCEGYAFALSYLCSMAGIKNYIVTGSNSEGTSHTWNKVLVDGKWYNVDCTWDDPILKREAPEFIRHDYMLVPDSDINGISHFPSEEYLPAIPCTYDDSNYFIKEGLYFSSADEGINSVKEQMKKEALAGGTEIEIRFSSESAYKKASEILFDNEGLKDYIEELNGNYGVKIKTATKITNDNLFTVHISLIY